MTEVPDALYASGSCPAGLFAEVGLRWCGVKAEQPMEILMQKPTKKSAHPKRSQKTAQRRTKPAVAPQSIAACRFQLKSPIVPG
jgi:hypothetical protein